MNIDTGGHRANAARTATGASVSWRRVTRIPGLRYALHLPEKLGPETAVLVSVHGISRNAWTHACKLGRPASARGAIVVAPLFDAERFPDYQQLGRRRGECPVDALHAILDDVSTVTGVAIGTFALFGYSGGAQFAHRYVLFHPRRVSFLVVGSAGWYTLPDSRQRYPAGTRGATVGACGMPDVDGFLRTPMLVVVGDADAERDGTLNRAPCVDRTQGATRIERAQSFVNCVRTAALRRGYTPQVSLQLLAGGTHDFEQNVRTAALARRVTDAVLDGRASGK